MAMAETRPGQRRETPLRVLVGDLFRHIPSVDRTHAGTPLIEGVAVSINSLDLRGVSHQKPNHPGSATPERTLTRKH